MNFYLNSGLIHLSNFVSANIKLKKYYQRRCTDVKVQRVNIFEVDRTTYQSISGQNSWQYMYFHRYILF